MGNLMPRIGEGRISDNYLFPHVIGEAETNVGDEALIGIGTEILAISFTGIVKMFEFTKASNEGQF